MRSRLKHSHFELNFTSRLTFKKQIKQKTTIYLYKYHNTQPHFLQHYSLSLLNNNTHNFLCNQKQWIPIKILPPIPTIETANPMMLLLLIQLPANTPNRITLSRFYAFAPNRFSCSTNTTFPTTILTFSTLPKTI